jgi:amino acid permease
MVHSDDHVNRPSIHGPYRPIRNGNIKGSTFAMLASALGTGCLNLPFRASQLGMIPFIIITLLAAALSYFGMYLMERIIIKYKVPSYS